MEGPFWRKGIWNVFAEPLERLAPGGPVVTRLRHRSRGGVSRQDARGRGPCEVDGEVNRPPYKGGPRE